MSFNRFYDLDAVKVLKSCDWGHFVDNKLATPPIYNLLTHAKCRNGVTVMLQGLTVREVSAKYFLCCVGKTVFLVYELVAGQPRHKGVYVFLMY